MFAISSTCMQCNFSFKIIISHFSFQDCSVVVLFRPIFISSIDNDLLVTPPFSDLSPPLNDTSMKNFECTVNHFVSLFHSLFTYLNLKEDIYSMGKFSEYVAEKLETLPAAVNRRNVSFLLQSCNITIINNENNKENNMRYYLILCTTEFNWCKRSDFNLCG